MGQYWKMLNVDARQELHNPGGLKLGEILYGEVAASIVPYLVVPPLPDMLPCITPSTGGGYSTVTNPITSLPVELLHHITSFLNPYDLICLGLACRTLLSHLCTRISHLLQRDAAPWVGQRIITLGDYANSLPLNLVTKEEIDELYEESGYLDDLDDEHSGSEETRRTLYGAAQYFYGRAGRNHLFNALMYRLAVPERKVLSTLQPSISWMSERSGSSSSQPVEWILRDLTKRQYVRSSTLARFSSGVPPNGPFLEPIGFGDVIIIRTSWTDDPSGTFGEMHGRWAGDRLDIVTLEQFAKEAQDGGENGEQWKDMSTQVARILFDVLGDKIHQHYKKHRLSTGTHGQGAVDPDETDDDEDVDDGYDREFEEYQDAFAWVKEGGGSECDVGDCAATFGRQGDLGTHKIMHRQRARAARMQAR